MSTMNAQQVSSHQKSVNYMVLSYLSLVLVNNIGYQLENMWVVYAPMFIGVYVFSSWIDSKMDKKDKEGRS